MGSVLIFAFNALIAAVSWSTIEESWLPSRPKATWDYSRYFAFAGS
jgi:hypothetical protein